MPTLQDFQGRIDSVVRSMVANGDAQVVVPGLTPGCVDVFSGEARVVARYAGPCINGNIYPFDRNNADPLVVADDFKRFMFNLAVSETIRIHKVDVRESITGPAGCIWMAYLALSNSVHGIASKNQLSTGASLPTSVRQEAPCGICKRPNDLGVKSCWWCGVLMPTLVDR